MKLNNKKISYIQFYGAGIISGIVIGKGINNFEVIKDSFPSVTPTNLVVTASLFTIGYKLITTAITTKIKDLVIEDNNISNSLSIESESYGK